MIGVDLIGMMITKEGATTMTGRGRKTVRWTVHRRCGRANQAALKKAATPKVLNSASSTAVRFLTGVCGQLALQPYGERLQEPF